MYNVVQFFTMGCKQSKSILSEREPRQEAVNLSRSKKFRNIVFGKPVATKSPICVKRLLTSKSPPSLHAGKLPVILRATWYYKMLILMMKSQGNYLSSAMKSNCHLSPSLGIKCHEFSGHCKPTPINILTTPAGLG